MFAASLPDPRRYPDTLPNSILITTACKLLRTKSGQQQDRHIELETIIDQCLRHNDMASITVALAMAPSQAAYRLLWQGLRNSIEQLDKRHAIIFALPLVLVAGSHHRVTLAGAIADVEALNQLFFTHQVFRPGAQVFLSGRLIHPDSLAQITALQLYQWTRQLADAARGLPLKLDAAPIELQGEGVFLRYLLGVALKEANEPDPILFSNAVGSWGMPLMKSLSTALYSEGVTLFPIPCPSAPFMQALLVGQQVRLQTALQVFVSNQLRTLRLAGQSPRAQLAAYDNHDIRLTLNAATHPGATFIWPLAPLDDIDAISTEIRQLLSACQVDTIDVLTTVQSDSFKTPYSP